MTQTSRFLLFLLLFFVLALAGAAILLQVCTVREIEVETDFDLNSKVLFDHLGIAPNRYIWQFNQGEITKKLDRLYFLDEYEVYKFYPNRVVLTLKVRKPVATVSGKKGTLYYIDRRGMIFAPVLFPLVTDGPIPHLILDSREKVEKGVQVEEVYLPLVKLLYVLKKREKSLFTAIAQVEINRQTGGGLVYGIFYKNNTKRIVLKNVINVEIIKKGLVAALFLEDTPGEHRDISYSSLGFNY